MTNEQKIIELRNKIKQYLVPLISNDYVLWGLPYHTNIGDVLIWQGELDFLKRIPYKCKGVCSWNTFPGSESSPRKVELQKKDVILLHGGGYLGDTWRNGWMFAMEGISQYPDNQIIILPQTIYYKDENLLKKDTEVLSRLKYLTICVRDKVSYEIAMKNFSSFAKVILVPDMAFCISSTWLRQWMKIPSSKKLYIKRIDVEAISESPYENMEDVVTRDWPTLETGFNKLSFKIHDKVMDYRSKFERHFPSISRFTSVLADAELNYFFRPEIIKVGVEFISSYQSVRTTRLHAVILSILLGKEVVSEDNSYGKLSSFYDTWLYDLPTVTLERLEK